VLLEVTMSEAWWTPNRDCLGDHTVLLEVTVRPRGSHGPVDAGQRRPSDVLRAGWLSGTLRRYLADADQQ